MKSIKKDFKKVAITLDGIILSYGGRASLANTGVMIRIQEELRWFYPDLSDTEMAKARARMNQLKPKRR